MDILLDSGPLENDDFVGGPRIGSIGRECGKHHDPSCWGLVSDLINGVGNKGWKPMVTWLRKGPKTYQPSPDLPSKHQKESDSDLVTKNHLKLSFLKANIHRKQNLNNNDLTCAANFPTPTTPASGRGCYVLHASVRDHRGHHAWDQRGTDGGGQLLLGGEEILAGWQGRVGRWKVEVLKALGWV